MSTASSQEKHASFRTLLLIATPKLADKAGEMFDEASLPMQYRMSAVGTASSEMLDVLGLGGVDKSLFVSFLPKYLADKMLVKLNKTLKLEAAGSGIAFTLPLSGVNNLLFKMLRHYEETEEQTGKKGDGVMAEYKYVMIASIVNQGFSEEVMNAARSAGAAGGTIIHSRRVGDQNALSLWGLSIQEEKEIVMIVADNEHKLDIMKAISEKCGMHSDAKGIVVSLPIDNVVGISEG